MECKTLTPICTTETETYIDNNEKHIETLVKALGSPLHFIFPGQVEKLIGMFRGALRNVGIAGQVYFAAKANKSDAFLHMASKSGAGVDVASREEFLAALSANVRGEDIVVTGPHKGKELHFLARTHGATVSIDNLVELSDVCAEASGRKGKAQKILLRYRPDTQRESRFGMSERELLNAIELKHNNVIVKGFTVHLSGYSLRERAEVGQQLVAFCTVAAKYGHIADTIDLGGGWPVSYVTRDDWAIFQKTNAPAHYHGGRIFPKTYPYFQALNGVDGFIHCLSICHNGTNLIDLCKTHSISLMIEPGRALVDKAGFTAFEIKSVVRRDEDNYSIITVAGKSFSLSEQWFNSEFLPSPQVLPKLSNSVSVNACVAGDSCLDDDMISWRKIFFEGGPSAGNCLIYHNTAGYQMDANESAFHRSAIPKKVAIWKSNEQWNWCLDEEFHRLAHEYRNRDMEDDC